MFSWSVYCSYHTCIVRCISRWPKPLSYSVCGLQVHHGVCEPGENKGSAAGKTVWHFSAALQREQQRWSHHLQLGWPLQRLSSPHTTSHEYCFYVSFSLSLHISPINTGQTKNHDDCWILSTPPILIHIALLTFLSVCGSHSGTRVHAVDPYTKDELLLMSLPNIINHYSLRAQRSSHRNPLIYLYPDIHKDQAFGRYYGGAFCFTSPPS